LLVLVPTPIGNLGDVTARALAALRDADTIVAEDTRHTRKLLAHLGVDASRLHRLDANATEADVQRVVGWLLEGRSVAAVTDAGTPGVSDPGAALVRAAVARGVTVTALPGPSAITTAVALSGLVDGPFRFAGFLPRTPRGLASAVADIASCREPVVLFEAPHRMGALARALAEAMPDRQVAVARELSKVHEEVIRGTLREVASVEREWLGEITLVLGAWEVTPAGGPDDAAVDARIDEHLAGGLHTRTVAERVAAWSGRDRRQVYARVVERKQQRG
jgi:16S rRNA (cytidine1402-2'-O)-methyltransferase